VIILRCTDHGNPKHGVELGDRSQILHRWITADPEEQPSFALHGRLSSCLGPTRD
jgi:hypothetical protein